MITNSDSTVDVSNLGWADHGSVWKFDAASMSARLFDISDAAHLQVGAGSADLFSAVHHFKGQRLMVTCRASLNRNVPSPSSRCDDDATGAAGYFVVRVQAGTATLTRLDWFGFNNDHDYQSVVAVNALPRPGNYSSESPARPSSSCVTPQVKSSSARSRSPVASGIQVHTYGSMPPNSEPSTTTPWSVLTDKSWAKTGELLGQKPQGGQGKFLGDMHFSPDERTALVSRPFSGDVLHIDTQTLTVTHATTTGGQPLKPAPRSTDS